MGTRQSPKMEAELLPTRYNQLPFQHQHTNMAMPQFFSPFGAIGTYDTQNNQLVSTYSAHPGRVEEFSSSLSNTASSDDYNQMSNHSVKHSDSPPGSNDTARHRPFAQTPRSRKRRPTENPETPELEAPLSELTKNSIIPVKDTNAWVNRSIEERHAESTRKLGKVPRPMNSFMLYRSAYAERTKQWFMQNNHQHVSKVSGRSWAMEPQEIRNQFDAWAKIERANHQLAFPNYKFSPSKTATKRQRGGADEDEMFVMPDENVSGELDHVVRQDSRNVRQRLITQPSPSMNHAMSSFESQPYYESRSVDSMRHIRDVDAKTSVMSPTHYPDADSFSSSGISWSSRHRPFETQPTSYVRSPVPTVPFDHYEQTSRVQHSPSFQMPAVMETMPVLSKYGVPNTPPPSAGLYPSSISSMVRQPQYAQQHFPSFGDLGFPHPSLASTSAPGQQRRYDQLSCTSRAVVDPVLGATSFAENLPRTAGNHKQRGQIESLTNGNSSEYGHVQTYYDLSPGAPVWPADLD